MDILEAEEEAVVECFSLPVKTMEYYGRTGRTLCSDSLYNMLDRQKEDIFFCLVELPICMPYQGVKSTFKTGEIFGRLTSVLELLNIPVTYVSPKEWQKNVFKDDDKEADTKARSIKEAAKIWPEILAVKNMEKRRGLADAICIAKYARQIYLEKFLPVCAKSPGVEDVKAISDFSR